MKTAIIAALMTTSVYAACSEEVTNLTASNKVRADTELKIATALKAKA
jgi:hypothetical protein